MISRAQSILFVPAVFLALSRRSGVISALNAAWPVGISIALTFAYNQTRFGDPLEFGYPTEGFTMPFLRGAHMLLLEPSEFLLKVWFVTRDVQVAVFHNH